NRAKVIGRSITDYLEESSLPTLAENFPRFVSTGQVEGPVFGLVSRDGAKRVVTVTGRIARDTQGNPHHTHCILTDITERQKAEDAIRASERRFSQLIQNSYDAVVILDAEGVQRFVSSSAERVHGYTPPNWSISR
ncbi:MAG: PAS domain-containing protein, partial [Rhodocyclaceae bacterium]|nr:PAS domain-containing protein [Rhodocyclaceae bacterium]